MVALKWFQKIYKVSFHIILTSCHRFNSRANLITVRKSKSNLTNRLNPTLLQDLPTKPLSLLTDWLIKFWRELKIPTRHQATVNRSWKSLCMSRFSNCKFQGGLNFNWLTGTELTVVYVLIVLTWKKPNWSPQKPSTGASQHSSSAPAAISFKSYVNAKQREQCCKFVAVFN